MDILQHGYPPPTSILIVGAGVFGLSTTLALLSSPRYDSTHITIIDSRTPTPTSPPAHGNPPTASIDSSRIVRADYAVAAYAELSSSAQKRWRQGWGGEEVYKECGLAFVTQNSGRGAEGYVEKSFENVTALEKEALEGSVSTGAERSSRIEVLKDRQDIERVMRATEGGSGDWGYVNWDSGWVDAAGAIEETRKKIEDIGKRRGNLEWVSGQVERLLFSDDSALHTASPAGATSTASPSTRIVTGVLLENHRSLHAPLTILASGAWTSSLLDLRTRVLPTGQVVSYIQLTPPEVARLASIPVILNESTGMFMIPPTRDGVLKIARHGYGYRNPVRIPHPERPGSGEEIEVSLPAVDFRTLPLEGSRACRQALAEMVPWLAERPFCTTRLCWYTDTPHGDFLVDYVPTYGRSLVIATGGSGHGYKFLPVLGEKVVERLEGRLGGELGKLWAWGEGLQGFAGCEDGSRGGRKGMFWAEEMERKQSV
ncbi:hypothetical protein MMC13_002461 [Lambiella insularis]|nr:hypothetical protein [Lambiella insularis]